MNDLNGIMTKGCECIGESDTVATAARRMQELEVGAMPICGDDNRLKGMLTDRDIVLKVVAAGLDPQHTPAAQLAEGKPVYVETDQSVDDALELMSEHQVRRLPVIDADKQLIGIISQGNVAARLENRQAGELVHSVSAA